jgi:hypothetical protein
MNPSSVICVATASHTPSDAWPSTVGVQIAWADRTDAVLSERRLLVLSGCQP